MAITGSQQELSLRVSFRELSGEGRDTMKSLLNAQRIEISRELMRRKVGLCRRIYRHVQDSSILLSRNRARSTRLWQAASEIPMTVATSCTSIS